MVSETFPVPPQSQILSNYYCRFVLTVTLFLWYCPSMCVNQNCFWTICKESFYVKTHSTLFCVFQLLWFIRVHCSHILLATIVSLCINVPVYLLYWLWMMKYLVQYNYSSKINIICFSWIANKMPRIKIAWL